MALWLYIRQTIPGGFLFYYEPSVPKCWPFLMNNENVTNRDKKKVTFSRIVIFCHESYVTLKSLSVGKNQEKKEN